MARENGMIYTGCWNGIAIVGGGVLAAVLLVVATRRLFPASDLRDGHESTGTMLTIVGTLYAVLLGLVVVDAMARFEKSCDDVQMESNCLADIYQLGKQIPDPYRRTIRDLCRTYAEQVVELEWPAMERAQMSLEARRTALGLAKALDGFEPETDAQKIVYPAILEQIRVMWDRRRDRAGAAEFGIPVVEWAVLIVGAVVTIFLGGLCRVGSSRLHLVATAMTALVIGLNLYLLCLFGYPFAGELSVSNRPFRVDIGIFDGIYDRVPAHEGESAGEAVPTAL
jgi:hypothetical protein